MQAPRILVIQNKRIGDVLISSVIAANIKKVYPQASISYFVYDYTAGVLEGNPNIDRIIKADAKHLKKPGNLMATAVRIRKMKFDIIFDPYGKFQSRLICLLSTAKIRIGLKRANKKYILPVYTIEQEFLSATDLDCGKAILDRVKMVQNHFELADPDYRPKIFLDTQEKAYNRIDNLPKPVVMMGVLGSSLDKSLPIPYIVALIDKLTNREKGTVLFNYAPHQKQLIEEIYSKCTNKDRIHLEVYEDSIRGFARLMNRCDLLIANEGGSVHIAKALNKPTFTIYSPYIDKAHWASFEKDAIHHSIHLKEARPELFKNYDLQERREIMKNPTPWYQQLTPDLIADKLFPYLDSLNLEEKD